MQRPCLKWLDMLYLLCMLLAKKIRKRTEENKKDRKMGEMIFSKRNNKIFNFCQIIIFFSSKKLEFSNTSKIQISDSKKTCRDLVLSDLICYTCYLCCSSKDHKKPRKTKKTEKREKWFFQRNILSVARQVT